MANVDQARKALNAIPPDLPIDEWVRAGMRANVAGLQLVDFDEWSAGAGSVSTANRYWSPAATIEAAAIIGADTWRQEVRAVRAALHRKSAVAMQEAQRQNQQVAHRASRRAAPGQTDLFAGMGVVHG